MKLSAEIFGADDRPTILMLHGSGSPPEMLQPWALALAESYRVVLPHRNGYGDTGVHEYNAEAELEGLLELAGDSAIIIGHSFGAFRAFQLAGMAPNRIKRVLAIGPIAGLPEEAREAVEGLAVVLRSGADVTDAIASNWLTPPYLAANPEILNTLREWFERMDREIVTRENLEILDQGHTMERLAASGVPVRMYVGEIDRATPPVLAQAIAQHVPDAVLTLVPDMSHSPMIEDLSGSIAWIRDALVS